MISYFQPPKSLNKIYFNHKLYLNHFQRGDQPVLVDNIPSTTRTLDAVLGVFQQVGINPKGVVAIQAKSNEYKKMEDKYLVPIIPLVEAVL